MRRLILVFVSLLALLVSGPAAAVGAAPPRAHSASHQVSVGGEVMSPKTYTAREIKAQPQVTVTTPSGRRVSGASLQSLAALSGPRLDSGKNALLRQTIAVRGSFGAARFAVGELDPNFGNHPALLTVRGSRVDLVVPGDAVPLRDVRGVRAITVGVVDPITAAPSVPGDITVRTPYGTRVVTTAELARLPQHRRTVTYQSGSGQQTRTERGPSLLTVLLSLGVLPWPGAVVTATGSDGYAAAVTPGEALVGGRPLLLSIEEDGAALEQPRLIPAGDIKGGRYVSDVTAISISLR